MYRRRMGRVKGHLENERRRLMLKLWCDMLEGVYPWPDGRVKPPGFTNKSEVLRAAGYSAGYAGGYKVFDTEEFQASVEHEMAQRRMAASVKDLPDRDQLESMRKLVNLELLHRLEESPEKIAVKDLVAIRQALAKLLPEGEGGETQQRRFPGVRIDKLLISLTGKIPEESLKAVTATSGVEVIEGEADDVS